MAEKSSFFTSKNGDRKYKSGDFAEYFKTIIGNGVFSNPSTNLQVVAIDNNMNIRIKPGKAWINGYLYQNTEDLILRLDNSDLSLSRIDNVVVRLDHIDRSIKCYIKKGVPDSNPSVPEVQRDENIYELVLAQVAIANNSIIINQSHVTDTRLNSKLCGLVTSVVDQIDTTELYNSLQSYIEERGNDIEGWVDTATIRWESEFRDWFKELIDIFGEEPAGNIALKVEQLENSINNIRPTADNVIITDTDNNFISNNVEGALQELFQCGVNTKDNMVQAINSKTSVPDLSRNSDWNSIKEAVLGIKEIKGNAIASDVLSGKTFSNSSAANISGTIPNRGGAQTITPGTSDKILNSGYYSGNITTKGSSTLIASNIVKGKVLFGITGTFDGGLATTKGTASVSGGYATVSANFGFLPSLIFFEDGNVYIDPKFYTSGLSKKIMRICKDANGSVSKLYELNSEEYVKETGFKLKCFHSNSVNWYAMEL